MSRWPANSVPLPHAVVEGEGEHQGSEGVQQVGDGVVDQRRGLARNRLQNQVVRHSIDECDGSPLMAPVDGGVALSVPDALPGLDDLGVLADLRTLENVAAAGGACFRAATGR